MNRNNAIIVKIIHSGKRFRGIMGYCGPATYVDHFQVIPAWVQFVGKFKCILTKSLSLNKINLVKSFLQSTFVHVMKKQLQNNHWWWHTNSKRGL
ncbi:hypothetical protein A3860_28520 [Niastella vici]|uniref:Uncharacterized protein n=1 Tax=Niastella vici TaxID=1703345 RepID=A0A1V9FVD8_9BACT|nr:hypothetical protein A3860_28520 [Niastella vici]